MSQIKCPQINQVAIAGRLTHDPEFKITNNGRGLVNFSVAVNQNYRDRAGEWQQKTSFVPVVAWDKLAEAVSQNLWKGSSAFVTGRLKSRKYETRDGNRTVLELIARCVQFLEKKKENGEDNPPF